jgi:hypothetical protein
MQHVFGETSVSACVGPKSKNRMLPGQGEPVGRIDDAPGSARAGLILLGLV